MTNHSRYDVLFEPIQIGPVTAPNRFYQTPHATGMGNLKPNSSAALRGLKAEGGWGVVCTEYCSIHPSADDSPYAYLTIWDETDVQHLNLTSDAIHEHGALAGIELWHGGFHTNNRETRVTPLGPMDGSAEYIQPGQVRGMDKDDIKQFRRWHQDAAKRAKRAGFDIVYIYAGHEFLPFQFLSPRFNHRKDEYGGCLENRVRLLKELIEDTKEAVGDSCAVAVRLAIDELHGEKGITCEGDGREVIKMLADLPDLWDIALGGGLRNDSCSSRFSEEAYQEKYVRYVKSVTTKPVVSVGRFTSPDTMVKLIKSGVQDFVGAARPSIADPFLPNKIKEGREDEIRECIGCNICRSSNNEGVSLRCTQNPTIGETWRRNWHPENFSKTSNSQHLLIVGGGPAGLEAALTLGRMGHQVTLADKGQELGGRLLLESKLPGLQNWIRVRDYRTHLLSKMSNVEIYLHSELSAQDITDFGADHIVIATGGAWRRDGVGANLRTPVIVESHSAFFTPDDVFAQKNIIGNVTIYDDDHYFMAGALAEQFLRKGHQVTYITPANMISSWTTMTDEQHFIQTRLLSLGMSVVFNQCIDRISARHIHTQCIYSEREEAHEFDNLVLVTSRKPNNSIAKSLNLKHLNCIGDCYAPSNIADAVYSGHLFAREFGGKQNELIPKRERVLIQDYDLL